MIVLSATPLEHSRYSLDQYNSQQLTFPISQWIPGLFGVDLFFSPGEFQLDWALQSHHSSRIHRPPCSVSHVENEVICPDRVWNCWFLRRKYHTYFRLAFQSICAASHCSSNRSLLAAVVTKKRLLMPDSTAIYMPNQFVFTGAPKVYFLQTVTGLAAQVLAFLTL